MTRQQVDVTRLYAVSDDEAREIKMLFDEFDMDARAEGMAFGGPAEFVAGVTVATILAPFFQSILSKAGEDAYLGLKKLTTRLVAFGRGKYGNVPEGGVAFTDGSLRLQFDPRLPDRAFRQFVALDLKQFENHRVTVTYSDRWGRWLAHPSSGSQPVARRLPVISSRASKAYKKAPRVRKLAEGENERLFRDRSRGSIVTSQRFDVIQKAGGWQHVDAAMIAAEMVVSIEFVTSIFADFNSVGLESLYVKYDDGRNPTLTPEQADETIAIARSAPAAYDLTSRSWTYSSLVDFLVAEGIVEDFGSHALKRFLDATGVKLSARTGEQGA
jgi:hypothetical protein